MWFSSDFLERIKKYKEILINFTSWLKTKQRISKDDISSACNDYLKVLGYVSLSYSWLRMLRVSYEKMDTNKSFFEEKINTGKYYFEKILPRAESHYISGITGSETMMRANFN